MAAGRRSARRAVQPSRRAAAAGEDWTAFVDMLGNLRARHGRLAGRDGAGAALVRAASRTPIRRRGGAPGKPIWCSAQIAAGYPSRERFLTELTLDPPDATSDRPGPAAARRGLPDPVDHPLGQGPGMEVGVRAQRRRRLHSVRSRAGPARLEEERRLLYVAMTRAKDDLHVMVPQRFFVAQQARSATATSTPPHPVHSGRHLGLVRELRVAHGRGQRGRGRRASRSISGRGCGGCGSDAHRQSRLERFPVGSNQKRFVAFEWL